jgi:hypothetical protein
MRKDLGIITILYLVIAIAFWFYAKTSRAGLASIYRAWDGPSYVIAAKSLYVPSRAVSYNSIQSPEIRADFTFLPAHFPGYPLLIRTFSFLGYYQAMIILALAGGYVTICLLYMYLRHLSVAHPLAVVLPALLLPPRWFILSHTGSSEPWFIAFVLASLYAYERGWFARSALMGAVALLFRAQGTLLGCAYFVLMGIELVETRDLRQILKKYSWYLLIPATLLAIFWFYQRQTGDFWAFFRAMALYHHLIPRLFPSFTSGVPSVETFWLEASVFDYVIYLAAIFRLFSLRRRPLATFGLVYYLPLIFLQHTDMSRYAVPLMPLVFIAFAEILAAPAWTWASLLTSPAIFAYATNFILNNRAP